jgi:hypothetical protein
VATFLLSHSHSPEECVAAFAAWRGFESDLRRKPAISTCLAGGHWIWWQVEAGTSKEALAKLPPFIAERSEAVEVREVAIP